MTVEFLEAISNLLEKLPTTDQLMVKSGSRSSRSYNARAIREEFCDFFNRHGQVGFGIKELTKLVVGLRDIISGLRNASNV